MLQAFRIWLLFFLMASADGVHAQNISLQLIHGSADPTVEKVDVWMDSIQIADNLSFRSATALTSYPSAGPLHLFVTDSSSVDTLLVYTDSLPGIEHQVLTLCGLVDSLAGYAHFEELQLIQLTTDLSAAQGSGNTDLIFVQAATDLESATLSEIREELGELFEDLSFGLYSDRIELYTEAYASSFSLNKETAIAPYVSCANLANEMLLGVNAGHDLSLDNIKFFKERIPNLLEVSIGHALISESLYLGIENVVQMYQYRLK